MRGDIFPDWSSPENKNGGFISIKIETKSRNYKIENITKTKVFEIKKKYQFLDKIFLRVMKKHSKIMPGSSSSCHIAGVSV